MPEKLVTHLVSVNPVGYVHRNRVTTPTFYQRMRRNEMSNPVAIEGEAVNFRDVIFEMRLTFEEVALLTGMEEHRLLEIVMRDEPVPVKLGDRVNELRGVKMRLAATPVSADIAAKLLRHLQDYGGSARLNEITGRLKIKVTELKYIAETDGTITI